MVELGAMSWSTAKKQVVHQTAITFNLHRGSPTDLLGDEITRIRVLTIISLPLFEYDPEQAWMSGFVAGSQLGRGFLVRGVSAAWRGAGGIRFEGDRHIGQCLNECL